MKLELSRISKTYQGHPALRDLSLHLPHFRVLTLIGPSGGGKSTLLRLLGGLEIPDTGSIHFNNHPLPTAENELLPWRRRNGFLFQQFNLFPHLSALENLTLPLRKVHHQTDQQARQTAEKALHRFNLLDHANKRPSQLSGGQQQRVAIARASLTTPEILFLDEPTSALDPEMTAEVLELIQQLAEDGQHIILTTHEMGFAKAVSDHVAFLSGGSILEHATPADFFSHPSSPEAQRFLSRILRYT